MTSVPPTAGTALLVDDVTTTCKAVRRAAQLWADKPAIADVQPGHNTRWTFAELAEQVRTFAAALVASGFRAGERALIWAPNTRHWVVAALGIQYAGGTLVPANTRYTGSEVLELIERTGARYAVVAGDFLGTERVAELHAAADGSLASTSLETMIRVPLGGQETTQADVVIQEWDAFMDGATPDARAEAERRADAVTGETEADILFTSGTTGKSKGVVALHKHTTAAARVWGRNGQLSEADRYLILNPFFHSFGYKAGFMVCLEFGTPMVPMAVVKPETMLDLIEAERISVLPGAPTVFQMLLDAPDRSEHDLSSLRLAVTGAAIVPVVLVERMQSDLGLDTVITAYGLTEASGMVTTCRPDDSDEVVATTCGRAFDGMEVRLADNGEVLARGEMVMAGYLDDPEATAQTIDSEGWLHTGDIGEIDEAGNLRITDRLKDMYISGGFNVYPAEIEQALARLDGVQDSAVIGVPDERLGEVGKAFVQRAESAAGHALDESAVLAFLSGKVAKFKQPHTVELVDELPRNSMGKVVKPELRARG